MTGRKINGHFFISNDKMRNKWIKNVTQASKPITEFICLRPFPISSKIAVSDNI